MATNKPTFLIVHHTGGTDADPKADTSHHTFEVVDDWHRQLWNEKSSLGHFIGYHYFIDKTGKVTQGRGDKDEGLHTKSYNLKSLGICLAGNFDVTKPTKAQETALRTLLQAKTAEYGIPVENILPHRRFANKSCYGNLLSGTWAQELLKVVPPVPPTPPASSNDAIVDEIRKHLTTVDTLLGKIK